MWLLVENVDNKPALAAACVTPFELRVHGVNIDLLKRGYRKYGFRVVAIYRPKHRELPDYNYDNNEEVKKRLEDALAKD